MERERGQRSVAASRRDSFRAALLRARVRGFTLIELMVTLIVAAILITVAVPGYKHLTATSQLTTMSNKIVGALHAARMEAVKNSGDTQFCSEDSSLNGAGTLGTACG